MQTEKKKVNWEQIKRCLALIDATSKDFLRQALLIGGAACIFYRHQLVRANDPDFRPAGTSPDEDARWLSRDLDFTGIFSQDALRLLPYYVEEHEGRKFIVVDGVRFGFAQVGLTFDPVEAMENAWVAGFGVDGGKIEFLVADPVTLYFEKCKLCTQRGNANDHLHRKMLFDYIAWESVRRAEHLLTNAALPVGESKNILQWWIRVKHKTPEILQDERIGKRLAPLLVDNPGHPIAQCLAGVRT